MPLVLATAMASASVENDPKAVTPASSAAAMTARTPSARSSGLAWAVPLRPAGVERRPAGRRTAGPPSRRAPRRWPRSPRRARRARGCPRRRPGPTTRRRPGGPSTNRRLTNASALATFWWISEFANRVRADSPADDQRLGLARAGRLGRVDDLLREAQRLLGVAPDPVLGAHPITPTRTLRNRPPETPCPTWPVCPGSPLPQFGVPHIRQLEASPTASIDRHSSYVMPV